MAFILRRCASAHTLSRIATPQRLLSSQHFLLQNILATPPTTRGNTTAANAPQTTTTTTTTPQLVVSESCQRRLREICKDGSFLRITVEGGGCSGFQYKFDLDTQMQEGDQQFGTDNAKVVVDTISLDYCAGSTIDYHTELIRAGFRMVSNPKAEQGCSCGASFAIKLD